MKRVLIANRGEIAIRIARAAAALGIESVSVHAPADALSLHTRVTDQTRQIGAGADPVKAYLDIDAIIEAARETGCDCVHPGYGFLAENAEFARRCLAEDLVFVGPSPEALALFGDKVAARELAAREGVPIIPGSQTALAGATDAVELAGKLGYPVMLKAAAGGGGRGMRRVDDKAEMAAAFVSAQREAEGAFGDGALFIEKLIDRPRHIEVQVLADQHGGLVHLYERDCSIQLRNQKVIEIAPAPGLDDELRQKILGDALKLARAGGLVNAATIEFLVAPNLGVHFFIECNPRIQVEHTVTEEATGIDLVEAQFRIADGERLADIGIERQTDIAPPRRYAVQARVVATGAGTITAYREPAGRGVRVDACGYLGLSPPPQFDPMFAKVICLSNSTGALESALERTRRALDDFHIAGLRTNLASLRAILDRPEVRAGDARTTLLADHPELLSAAEAAAAPASARSLFDAQAAALGGGPRVQASLQSLTPSPSLEVRDGEAGVECPMAGSVVELAAAPGSEVAAGDVLMVVSAMKMETAVTAPCAGVVAELAPVEVGGAVAAGQIVATITPTDGAGPLRTHGEDTWAPMLDEVKTLQDIAHARFAPGSTDPGVVRQRNRGKLTCRERIDLLLDPGSFHEVGSIAGFASYDADGRISDFTPSNHIGGWGRVDGRTAIVCADDFTSRGGHADGAIGAKSFYLDQLSMQLQVPSVRLLDGSSGGGSVAAMVPEQKKDGESTAKESSGAIQAGRPRVTGAGGSFLPGHLGSTEYTQQLSTVPVVNVLLGSVVGIGAAKAVLGHFAVMVRDIAQLFVAGPPVVSHAMGYDITKEDLGDWRIHCRNGAVDNLAETEEDAIAQTKRFLSYLPPSVYEAPPHVAPAADDPADRAEEELFTIVPRKRTTTFDMRRAIRLMADRGSFFEVG
ncbi:MAG TPA: carboxyl transferase domain-containing protein, partial [Caulobacteraceae bacterium]|nr:carboxyl transferase domain-containing protein [Caulobacteraceae bacterium]